MRLVAILMTVQVMSDDMTNQMSDGIERSRLVAVFITRTYIDKVRDERCGCHSSHHSAWARRGAVTGASGDCRGRCWVPMRAVMGVDALAWPALSAGGEPLIATRIATDCH